MQNESAEHLSYYCTHCKRPHRVGNSFADSETLFKGHAHYALVVRSSFREEDCGGVLGCDGNVYSDADPGL